MEKLLYWAFPAVIALAGIKLKFITGWRLFVSAVIALYIGVWLAPSWWDLLDFLPPEFELYRCAAAVVAGFLLLFLLLFVISGALMNKEPESVAFPEFTGRVLNFFFCFGFGLTLITLFTLVLGMTPLRTFARNDGEKLIELGSASLLRISSIGDSVTKNTPLPTREEAIEKWWYIKPEPERKLTAYDRAGGTGVTAPSLPQGITGTTETPDGTLKTQR